MYSTYLLTYSLHAQAATYYNNYNSYTIYNQINQLISNGGPQLPKNSALLKIRVFIVQVTKKQNEKKTKLRAKK